METFSDRMRNLRKEKDVTLEELANILNTTKATLSRYENNLRVPNADFIQELAEFFNVSTDYLLGRTDIKNPEDKIKNLDKLAHKEINSVEDALEIIESQEGLMLKGEMLTDEDKLLLANALQLGMKYVLDKKQKEKK
ncbi:helix-turn-helix domain-containing protein [Tissierella praeacuta]|uniref:helix-turn-helix domain-containing protein n=1 Tax=Tissierella praeacuta TaxID=43131 RepID=UPI0028A6A63B|nr:helix-turn-helix transcriptional regulator [Tissierella praeacuta]